MIDAIILMPVQSNKQIISLLDTMLESSSFPHALLCVGGDVNENRRVIDYIACELQGSEVPPDVSVHVGSMSVEEARDIVRRASLSPYVGPYSIYIIMDAHELSRESANTLLKCIEEPVHSTLFLLSATSQGAVLPTIASRCSVLRVAGAALRGAGVFDDSARANLIEFEEGDIAVRLNIAEKMHKLPREEVALILEAWAGLSLPENPEASRMFFNVSRAISANAHIQAALTHVSLSLTKEPAV